MEIHTICKEERESGRDKERICYHCNLKFFGSVTWWWEFNRTAAQAKQLLLPCNQLTARCVQCIPKRKTCEGLPQETLQYLNVFLQDDGCFVSDWTRFGSPFCMRNNLSQRWERALRRGLVRPVLAVFQMAAVSVSRVVRDLGRPAFFFFFFLRLFIRPVEVVASLARGAVAGKNKQVLFSKKWAENSNLFTWAQDTYRKTQAKVEIITLTINTACSV